MIGDGLVASAYGTRLETHVENLLCKAKEVGEPSSHGDFQRWWQVLGELPVVKPGLAGLNADAVSARGAELTGEQLERIRRLLMQFHPWRKGPFNVHGVFVDSEWRSFLKWDRLAGAIQPLRNRLVLDVGCGNGYYGWRMLGEGARLVLGIDPTHLYFMQFEAIRHFLGDQHSLFVLPLSLEQLPVMKGVFDSLFSMGVMYHRRSPFDHLLTLRDLLRPGGELVLETLVIPGGAGEVLVPGSRYAKMRNVWFIPSAEALCGWLARAGFKAPRVVDISITTTHEQRSTDWMHFQSLRDFLDPEDESRTMEGYPAPRRALVVASR